MNCDPDDQKVTLRQVPAGWILGLATVGLAFAATGLSPRDAERECRWSACATAARAARSIGSTRLPDFTPYAAAKRAGVKTAEGPVSCPQNPAAKDRG